MSSTPKYYFESVLSNKIDLKRNGNNLLSLAVLPRIDILKKSDEEIKLAEISENLPELKIVKGRKSDYSS